jgi:hypothetical protein
MAAILSLVSVSAYAEPIGITILDAQYSTTVGIHAIQLSGDEQVTMSRTMQSDTP